MSAPTIAAPAPAPRVRVEPVSPTPARFGLFAAARVLDGGQGHEFNGIEYQSVCSSEVTPYPPPCGPVDTGLELTKHAAPTTSLVAADPMALYAADDCPPVGRDVDTATDQLRARFLTGEQPAVEHAVATGEWGNAPSLADSALVLAEGAALDPADALGLVEAWLAANVGQGVIHAPRYTAGRFDSHERKTNGQVQNTSLGNTWAWGNYPGTAPLVSTVADDGTAWLYATGPVTIRRGSLVEPADWTSGGFGTRDNSTFLLVERLYVVDWPCRAVAVRTTIPRRSLDVSGGEAA